MSVQTKRWTRSEYDRLVALGLLGEDDRVQLVDGEIIEMPPQGAPHVTGTRLLEEFLRRAFGTGYDVRVQFPLALGEHSEPEPDVAVVTGDPRDYSRHHPTSAVLVVEVADTTVAFDRKRKAPIYATSGIAEYWLLNLPDQTLEVYRDPDPASPRGPHYAARLVLRAGETVAPLARPEIQILVADLLP